MLLFTFVMILNLNRCEIFFFVSNIFCVSGCRSPPGVSGVSSVWRRYLCRGGGDDETSVRGLAAAAVAATLWSLWSRSRAPTPHGPGTRHAKNAWMNITELNISSKSQTMSPNIFLFVSIKTSTSAAASGWQLEVSTQNTCSRQTLSKSRRRYSIDIESVPDHRLWFVTPPSEILSGDSSWAGSCNLQLTVQIVQCNEGFLAVHSNPSGLFHDTPSFLLTDMKAKKNHGQSSKLSIANELRIFRYTKCRKYGNPPLGPCVQSVLYLIVARAVLCTALVLPCTLGSRLCDPQSRVLSPRIADLYSTCRKKCNVVIAYGISRIL